MKIGTTELLVILAIVVVLFGPTQLPKLARMFGETIKNFRNGMSGAGAKTEEKAKEEAQEQVKAETKENA